MTEMVVEAGKEEEEEGAEVEEEEAGSFSCERSVIEPEPGFEAPLGYIALFIIVTLLLMVLLIVCAMAGLLLLLLLPLPLG